MHSLPLSTMHATAYMAPSRPVAIIIFQTSLPARESLRPHGAYGLQACTAGYKPEALPRVREGRGNKSGQREGLCESTEGPRLQRSLDRDRESHISKLPTVHRKELILCFTLVRPSYHFDPAGDLPHSTVPVDQQKIPTPRTITK